MRSKGTVLRFLIVTTAHPLDDVRVYQKFARSLLAEGHQILWVGPNTTLAMDGDCQDKRIQYELVPRIGGRFGRLATAIHVFASACAKSSGADWIYTPDPDGAFLLSLLPRRSRSKMIFDIHENYHEGALARWLGPGGFQRVLGLARHVLRWVASRFDIVIGVNNSIIKYYADHHPGAMVCRNCAPLRLIEIYTSSYSETGEVALVMHGKADTGRGTLQVLQALKFIDLRDIIIVLIKPRTWTDSAESVEIQRLIEQEADRLLLLEAMPMEDLAGITAKCALGLISYQRDLGVDSLPNRLFEYMAAGVPVLAPSYSLEIAQVILSERCGELVDFEEPVAIAEGIIAHLTDPENAKLKGARGREAFMARHNWETEFSRLMELMGQHE